MPIITFIAAQLSAAMKAELIEKVTNTAVEVIGIPK